MVQNLPSSAGDTGSISVEGATKPAHCSKKSPHAAALEARAPQEAASVLATAGEAHELRHRPSAANM